MNECIINHSMDHPEGAHFWVWIESRAVASVRSLLFVCHVFTRTEQSAFLNEGSCLLPYRTNESQDVISFIKHNTVCVFWALVQNHHERVGNTVS